MSFQHAIDVLEFINVATLVNECLRQIGVEKRINTCIFYVVIDSILNQRTFTDKELKENFKAYKEFRLFANATDKLSKVDDYHIDYDIEDIFLGLNVDKSSFSNEQDDQFNDERHDLFDNYLNDITTLNELIKDQIIKSGLSILMMLVRS